MSAKIRKGRRVPSNRLTRSGMHSERGRMGAYSLRTEILCESGMKMDESYADQTQKFEAQTYSLVSRLPIVDPR